MEPPFPSEMTSFEKDKTPNGHERYSEIISTLPKDEGWKPFGFSHQYQGFWIYPIVLEGVLSAQQHFKAQPSDLIVSSAPKTGTTWLKALTYAIVTRTRFGPSTSPLLTTMPHQCVPFLETDLFVENSTTIRDPTLPLVATHISYTSLPKSIMDSGCKIVYMFRDPKDAFVSLWHFTRRFLIPKDKEHCPLEEAFKLFCKGISFYGPYWDHVIGYWKASLECPDRVLVLKYEDVMRDTEFYVKRLAEFMGHPFSLEEEKEGTVQNIINLCSFENLSNLNVNKNGMHRLNNSEKIENSSYFRKGKIGDWENYLTAEMAEQMDRITDNKFGSLGLH